MPDNYNHVQEWTDRWRLERPFQEDLDNFVMPLIEEERVQMIKVLEDFLASIDHDKEAMEGMVMRKQIKTFFSHILHRLAYL